MEKQVPPCSQEAFIARNIKTYLIQKGYRDGHISPAVEYALTHYRSGNYDRTNVFKSCLEKSLYFIKRPPKYGGEDVTIT
ncbi:hypothetical protein OH456_06825 [Vibrio sp. La 4.2.2]|uniref:hypothetical protein n=1 Tax=Vibrio sp. La 4.2.2 TaxID=2998830 RepID=UPI0022CE1587|nr:hypothetical protein [Vibrio sp. La 4.2.2]MDA0107849.1 hypothetical protein [Vibrio sp. La 4.2.2]